jgi:hypothetical protein
MKKTYQDLTEASTITPLQFGTMINKSSSIKQLC